MTRMKMLGCLFAAGIALSAGAAQATTTFKGTYSVSYNPGPSGLGLIVEDTTPGAGNGFEVTLGEGDTLTLPTFKVYTNEAALDFADLMANPFSVTYNFYEPENFGGTIDGESGATFTFTLQGWFLRQNNFGYVNLENGGNMPLSYGDGGVLNVKTDNGGVFNLRQTNLGNFVLNPGVANAAFFDTEFSLISESAVPEPGTWALMILGFGGIGGALRNNRRKLVFA